MTYDSDTCVLVKHVYEIDLQISEHVPLRGDDNPLPTARTSLDSSESVAPLAAPRSSLPKKTNEMKNTRSGYKKIKKSKVLGNYKNFQQRFSCLSLLWLSGPQTSSNPLPVREFARSIWAISLTRDQIALDNKRNLCLVCRAFLRVVQTPAVQDSPPLWQQGHLGLPQCC